MNKRDLNLFIEYINSSKTMSIIGKEHGLSSTRVGQIIKNVIKRLYYFKEYTRLALPTPDKGKFYSSKKLKEDSKVFIDFINCVYETKEKKVKVKSQINEEVRINKKQRRLQKNEN